MPIREWSWVAHYAELVFSMRARMGIQLRLGLSAVFTEIGKLTISW